MSNPLTEPVSTSIVEAFTKPPTVLVVDDQPDNFDVLEALLYNEGYELTYSPNGRSALKDIHLYQPDAILLDVMMPDLDGIAVCKQLKADPRWQAVPIVMVTALADKKDLARCLAAGADDFISKPVDGLELRSRLRSMLRLKHQHDSLQALAQMQAQTIDLLEANLNELRGTMARALPHELNTPLNGMFGAIDLLLVDFEDMSSDEIQELLQIARQSAQRLERLTQRFLTYIKFELAAGRRSQGVSRPIEPLPIDHVAPSIAKTIAQRCQRAEDLVYTVEPCWGLITEADFMAALEELLDNAFKFSESGTPVTLVAQPWGDQIHISITNQGRGMSNEQIQRVGAFLQFERQTYEQQGLGLGLAIASKVARLYGGRLDLNNETPGELQVQLALPLTAPLSNPLA